MPILETTIHNFSTLCYGSSLTIWFNLGVILAQVIGLEQVFGNSSWWLIPRLTPAKFGRTDANMFLQMVLTTLDCRQYQTEKNLLVAPD